MNMLTNAVAAYSVEFHFKVTAYGSGIAKDHPAMKWLLYCNQTMRLYLKR